MTVHFSGKEGSFQDECFQNLIEEGSQFHVLDVVVVLLFFFSLKSLIFFF